jgi:hypothetical protein
MTALLEFGSVGKIAASTASSPSSATDIAPLDSMFIPQR